MKALPRWEKWAFRFQFLARASFLMVLGVSGCFAQELARTDRAAALAAAKTITVPAVRSHMRFLSDGLLEGRATGSRGQEIAAVYVASQLESMGVQPAGENGTYFQNVPLRKAINDGSKSSFSLVNGANVVRLKDSIDYLFQADLEHTKNY